LLKKSPASARHVVWGISLLGLLALPWLSVLLPPLNVPLLPAWAGSPRARVKQGESIERVPGAIEVTARAESTDRIAQGTGEADRAAVPTVPTSEPVFLNPPIDRDLGPAPTGMGQRLKLILALFWLAGFLVSLSRWSAGMIGARMIIRRSLSVAGAECLGDFSDLRHSLAVARSVRLLEYDGGSMPMTCGIIRPAIVLPVSHREWSPE